MFEVLSPALGVYERIAEALGLAWPPDVTEEHVTHFLLIITTCPSHV